MGIFNINDSLAEAVQDQLQDVLDEETATATTYFNPQGNETSVNPDDLYAWMLKTYPDNFSNQNSIEMLFRGTEPGDPSATSLWNTYANRFKEAGSPVAGTETETGTETDTETATAAPDPYGRFTEQNYDIHDRTSDAWDEHGRWIPPNDAWVSRAVVDTGEGWRIVEAEDLEGATLDLNRDGVASNWIKDGQVVGKSFTWDQLFTWQGGNWDKGGTHHDLYSLMQAVDDAGNRFFDDVFPWMTDLGHGNPMDVIGQHFNTTQWNLMGAGNAEQSVGKRADQRLAVLRHYQNDYYGTDTTPGFSDELKDDVSWGLDIQRGWLNHWRYSKGLDNVGNYREIYEQLMGRTSAGEFLNVGDDYFEYGSYADFAQYNASSHHKVLNAMRQYMFGETNYRQAYTTVEQYREAYQMYRDLSEEERTKALNWSAKYIEPYKLHQETAANSAPWTYNPSIQFDPETNTTSYYDPFVGHAKVDLDGNPITKTIEPIAEPQELLIRTGTDQPEVDADGNRIINKSAIEELYHKYLGRNPEQGGLDYWLNGNQGTFTDIENNIRISEEATNYSGNDSPTNTYLNPQAYGSPESIKAKLASSPSTVTPPTITIRNIGQPTKPTQSYMSLPAQWLTEAPQKIAGSVPGDTE